MKKQFKKPIMAVLAKACKEPVLTPGMAKLFKLDKACIIKPRVGKYVKQ